MNKRILIAEDSSAIQNLVRNVLKFQKYDIEIAKNGQNVLDLLVENTYNAIILDLNMPVMNGIECATKIRALENEKATIPIIALTGNAQNFTREEFLQMGFNEYLPKPINFDDLIKTLNLVCTE